MHKFDEFIHKELAPHLGPGEGIELTGFLYTKSLKQVVVSGGLSLMGDGYFFAALTRRRMFVIATEMGFASLNMVNKGLGEILYSDIKSIKPSGFFNQKMIAIQLKDGKVLTFRLNSLATHYASGQKQFIDTLIQFQQAAL
ncbi:MAG TPA: hypothetical protein PK152_16190 [Anaerolineales bacterium]|jgi:hypothetical protein|nr:hypothetical protein [Anaerolineae bacterium]HRJ55014.1 hypothetical protein [Anaerolineales bacterium]HRK90677.1 hypothetical protein [Anaerolineales bacterium]